MHNEVQKLKDQIAKVYLGDPGSIDLLLCSLFARGHALLEDVPGVGKTLLASTIARSIDASFSRVQLTPDMLPSDLIGITMISPTTHETTFKPGPVFANVVLADEINRTTPRTQSALLEAMSEGSVSIDGTTHLLSDPFMVIATQNPNDFIGTYPLPENQLDRFLMRISLGYPSPDAETDLLEIRPAQTMIHTVEPVLTASAVVEIQTAVDKVHMSESVRGYIVELARSTRDDERVDVGVSPRGSLAIAHAARAWAWIHERDFVTPDDVHNLIEHVWAHRIMIAGSSGSGAWEQAASVLRSISDRVPAPV